ncbi:tellurite resistance TerB family protein [Parvibaculum sp.]|jgi:uncharacterized tellurite resistance protein B-like protein|uniref:tellurite resistance TerB family protein n=1 Tax=Parvibaculum sp. TaxID=2024848 RepID=UPI002FDAB4F7
MLEKVLSFIERGRDGDEMPDGRKHAAATALMVEAARLDRDFSASERDAIKRLIVEKFGLDSEEARELIAIAESEDRMVYDDRPFLESIRRGFSLEEKRELVEILWQLSLADENLHHFEEYLIWHMTQELGMSREDCEAARAAAISRTA